MSAAELAAPFVAAIALPLMSALDFCLFTTIWDDPKEFEAGRFAADMMVRYGPNCSTKRYFHAM
jgi:hypothetical protein